MDLYVFRGYLRNKEGKVVPWGMTARGPFQFDCDLPHNDPDFDLHWVRIRKPRFILGGAINVCSNIRETAVTDCLRTILESLKDETDIEILDESGEPISLSVSHFRVFQLKNWKLP